MGMNLVQKILSTHRVSGQVVPGEGVSISGDQTLMADRKSIDHVRCHRHFEPRSDPPQFRTGIKRSA
jgi:hypothetical protein